MKRAAAFLLALSFVLLAGAAAQGQSFLTPREVDLVRILPPPPPDDSPQTRGELAEVLSIQSKRTPEMANRARDDSDETIWRFADVLGPRFTKDALPRTGELFARLHETEGAIVDPAKEAYKRPRPFVMSDRVHPVAKLSKSGSYPSGHSTGGTLMGIVLADMVPEKRREIMARAAEYGFNRIVAGVHFRTDVEAGRIAGSVIAQTLFGRDDFHAALEAARKELRAALELP